MVILWLYYGYIMVQHCTNTMPHVASAVIRGSKPAVTRRGKTHRFIRACREATHTTQEVQENRATENMQAERSSKGAKLNQLGCRR